MLRYISAIIKISRPINFVLTFLSIVVAGFIASKKFDLSFVLFSAALAGAFSSAAGNIINDYYDVEIDKINRPDRIIPSNLMSKESVLKLYFVFLAISLLPAIYLPLQASVILICSAYIIFMYSFRLKKIPFYGNVVVAFMTGFAFIFGAASAGNMKAGIIPGVFAFLINLMREIVKDMEDVEGDHKSLIKTYPQIYGFKEAKALINQIGILLFVCTLVPFIFEIYTIEFFVAVMIVVNPFLIFTLKKLYFSTTKENFHTVSNYLKLNMLFGLIAIILGA